MRAIECPWGCVGPCGLCASIEAGDSGEPGAVVVGVFAGLGLGGFLVGLYLVVCLLWPS